MPYVNGQEYPYTPEGMQQAQLAQAGQVLNSVAPPGERLAYLNPEEEAILRQMGGAGTEWAPGIPSYWKPFKDPFGKKKAARKAQEAQKAAVDEQNAEIQRRENRSNKMGWVTQGVGEGRGELFDFTDEAKLDAYLASPGDANYEEGFSQGGKVMDPFPDYARETGDLILNNLEEASAAAPEYIGSATDRMDKFQGTFDKLDSGMDSAVDTMSGIYDGTMQNRMEASNNELEGILGELKDLNTMEAVQSRKLHEDYGDALASTVYEELEANDAQLVGEQAKAAVGRRNASLDAARGMRGLQNYTPGTGSSMANMMMNSERGMRQSDLLADALIDHSVRRGEINPANADVYRTEVALKMGTPELAAQMQNLGIDEGIVTNREALADEIMNRQLTNVDALSGMGMSKATLPSLFGEAALAPTGPFEKRAAPFTSTGALAPGQTTFNQVPYTPAPLPSSSTDWLGMLEKAPGIYDKGKDAFGKIKGIFS